MLSKKMILFIAMLCFMFMQKTYAQFPVDTQYKSILAGTKTLPAYLDSTIDNTVPTPMVITRITTYSESWEWYPTHDYSKIQPWNSNATMYKFSSAMLFNAKTHSLIRDLPGSYIYPSYWSNTDPDLMYSFREDGNIRTYTVHNDYFNDIFMLEGYERVFLGPGEANIDKNDHYVALIGKTNSDLTVIVFDLQNKEIAFADTLKDAWGDTKYPKYIDWVSISQSGDYVVIMWNHNTTSESNPLNGHYGVEVYNAADMKYLRRLAKYGNHGDLGYAVDGREVFVQFWGPTGTINMYYLDALERVVLTSNSDFSGEGHLSCRNINRPGWAYVSQDYHTKQIVALKLDDSGTAELFGHHYSSSSSYAKSPMPVPSPNGDVVMFKSDFGNSSNSDEVYSFEVKVAKNVETPELVGHWTFDDPDNTTKADVGLDFVLTGTDSVVAGPMPDNGAVAIGVGSYFYCEHQLVPADSENTIDEYTLIMDIRPVTKYKYCSLFQTVLANNSDASFFIYPDNNLGNSDTGISPGQVVKDSVWTRVALTVKIGERVVYYVDGDSIFNGDPNTRRIRFDSLAVLFFADNNGEDNLIEVADVKLYSKALTSKQIKELGTIELPPPPISELMVGHWTFDDPNDLTNAEIGNDLVLRGQDSLQTAVPGPEQEDGAVAIDVGSYYYCDHELTPLEGEQRINNYTLVWDARVVTAGKWHCLFNADAEGNEDGDFFIGSAGQLGAIGPGYTDHDVIMDSIWYRIGLAVDVGNKITYYVNGDSVFSAGGGVVDNSRFSLDPLGIRFFNDDDGEDYLLEIADIKLFSSVLSSKQMEEIGGIAPPTSIGKDRQNNVIHTSQLYTNYPNPFNPSTTIKFDIGNAGNVVLNIYSSNGELVTKLVNKKMIPGSYSVVWNGKNSSGMMMSSGIYFYRLKTVDYQKTGKAVLLK